MSNPTPHPGEILLEKYMRPNKITIYRLSKDLFVRLSNFERIIAGEGGITAQLDLRLSRYFGTSEGFWIGLQTQYDLSVAKGAHGTVLEKIKPFRPAS